MQKLNNLALILLQRESSMLSGVDYKLEDFYQDTLSLDEFCQHLCLDHWISRGLPAPTSLSQYAPAMRALLYHESISSDDSISLKYVNNDIRLILKNAYKLGFVNKDEADGYTFASPLHRQLWSWRLLPQSDYQFPFQDILSFVKETVSLFRPSQLVSDRRVGPPNHRPLEAQYQDEYYRCVHALTDGNVQITPEYAAAIGSRIGSIDFFIPLKKWGIELTREGDRLRQNDARFAADGAYGKWLASSDMENYVLLDFRSTIPMRAHQGKKVVIMSLGQC